MIQFQEIASRMPEGLKEQFMSLPSSIIREVEEEDTLDTPATNKTIAKDEDFEDEIDFNADDEDEEDEGFESIFEDENDEDDELDVMGSDDDEDFEDDDDDSFDFAKLFSSDDDGDDDLFGDEE